MVFHAPNRGVRLIEIFSKDEDYAAFEGAIVERFHLYAMRVVAFCWMPNL